MKKIIALFLVRKMFFFAALIRNLLPLAATSYAVHLSIGAGTTSVVTACLFTFAALMQFVLDWITLREK